MYVVDGIINNWRLRYWDCQKCRLKELNYHLQGIFQLQTYYGLIGDKEVSMAIWQFKCNIVPAWDNIEALDHDAKISWRDVVQPTCDIEFLEREKSWSNGIVQYGKTEETCIEFFYVENMLEEIECRLDLRSLTKQKLVSLIEYVQNIGAMFLVGDKAYPPKLDVMVEVMKYSEANRYCKNPLKYFLSLNGVG